MQRSAPNKHKWARACLWFDDPDPPPPRIFSWQWLKEKRATVGNVLHSLPMQVLITALIVFDLVLCIQELSSAEEDYKTLGAIVITLLCVEILVRIFVEGIRFFKSLINDIEAGIIFGALVLIFAGPKVPVGLGRILKPISRMLRAGRVALKMWLRGSQLKRSGAQLIAEKVKGTITTIINRLIRIRPENMHLDLQDGIFNIKKARIFAEALEGVHLPVLVHGGFVEDVYIYMPTPTIQTPYVRRFIARFFEGSEPEVPKEKSIVIEVRNILLVLGPGADVDWQDEEALKERKSKLVDLVEKFIPQSLPTVAPSEAVMNYSQTSAKNLCEKRTMSQIVMNKLDVLSKMFKRVILDAVRKKLVSGVKIRISNTTVQYERFESDSSTNGHPIADPSKIVTTRRPLSYNLGFKLGLFSVTTAIHKNELMKMLTDRRSLSVSTLTPHSDAGNHGYPEEKNGDPCYSKRARGHSFMSEADTNLMDENVSIRLERVSTYCNMWPSSEICYRPLLPKMHIQTALDKLVSFDRLERVRQALARSKPIADRRNDQRSPCAGRGEPLPLMLQQHSYVMLPTAIRLNWSIPGLVGEACVVDDDEDSRALSISSTPVSIVLDNHQLEAINDLFLYLRTYFKQDRRFQVRPEIRICQVLPKKGVEESWQDRCVRKAVVMQWWFHALFIIKGLSRASSHTSASFLEVQIRASRRLEYMELVAHHKFRVREYNRSRTLMRFLSCILGWSLEQEDTVVCERLKQLQMRMGIYDIVLAMMEARYLAAQREADTKARRRRACLKLKAYVRQASHSGGTLVYDKQVEDQLLQELMLQLADFGLKLDTFLPEYVSVRFPVVEMCLYTVNEWMVKSIGMQPPRYHPHGTRHKLIHGWMRHAGCVFFFAYAERHHSLPSVALESIKVFCQAVGAQYCNSRTGEEREAIAYEPVPSSEPGHVMVAHMTRDPNTDPKVLNILKRTGPTTLFDEPHASKDPRDASKSSWKGIIYLGSLSIKLDMMQFRRVQQMVGDLGIAACEKVVRLVLAEPCWRFKIPELQFNDYDQCPKQQQARIEEAELNRYMHRVARLTELLTCIVLPINSDIDLEVKSWGYQCSILQPDWEENQWRDWLQEQEVSYGGFPGRRPPGPAVHTLKGEVRMPLIRLAVRRTNHPAQVSLELLPLQEKDSFISAIGVLPDAEHSDRFPSRSQSSVIGPSASAMEDSVEKKKGKANQPCDVMAFEGFGQELGNPLALATLKRIVVVSCDQ